LAALRLPARLLAASLAQANQRPKTLKACCVTQRKAARLAQELARFFSLSRLALARFTGKAQHA
jgi:hypothetical protein